MIPVWDVLGLVGVAVAALTSAWLVPLYFRDARRARERGAEIVAQLAVLQEQQVGLAQQTVAAVAELLDGYTQTTAAQALGQRSAVGTDERESIRTAATVNLVGLLDQIVGEGKGEAVVGLAGSSALGRKALKVAMRLAGDSPEAAAALLRPWLGRVAGSTVSVSRGQGSLTDWK